MDMNKLIEVCIAKRDKVMAFPIYEYWRDIGIKENYIAAIADYKN